MPPSRPTRLVLALGAVGLLLLAGCSSSGRSEADGPAPSSTTTAAPAVSTTTTEPAFACEPSTPGEHTISSDGADRTYRIAVPEDPTGPVPLVVLFHGFASGAEEMDRVTGLDVTGPAAGVAVLTPQGAGAVAGWPILGGFDVEQRFIDAAIAEVSDGGASTPMRCGSPASAPAPRSPASTGAAGPTGWPGWSWPTACRRRCAPRTVRRAR